MEMLDWVLTNHNSHIFGLDLSSVSLLLWGWITFLSFNLLRFQYWLSATGSCAEYLLSKVVVILF